MFRERVLRSQEDTEMSSRRMEFFIGMMVIGIIAGVFVMTILFGSERGFFVGNKGGQRMTIVFEKGGGISQNSLVLKNGIKIGRVYSVELVDSSDRSEVHVSFELDPNYKLYSNEYAKINRTILGDASIEFVDDPKYVGEIFEIGKDDVIPGKNTGDLMGTVSNIEGDLAQALQNINKASEGVSEFMKNINDFIGDDVEREAKKERLQDVFTNLAGTLESIKSLADNLDLVVSDEEIVSNIRTTTSEAPKLLKQVNDLTNGAQNFMDSAQEIGNEIRSTLSRAKTTFDLVDKNLDNVSVFTASLAEDGPQMMSALNESSAEVKTTISNIRNAVLNISDLAATLNEKIDDPNSPLGVLTDNETADSLRHIIKNAEEISQKLYPILDDTRVFTNKIAHRPSSLVWDRTTSKGVNTEYKFGRQTLSPTGGVSSPLYRQTAAGAKIRERNYYEPSADTNYMDDATRASYESAVAELEAARSRNAENAISVLPSVSTKGKSGLLSGNLRKSCEERKDRVRWTLASLWDSLRGAKKEEADFCDESGEYYGAPVEAQALEPFSASFVGYDQYADGNPVVGQPVFNAIDDGYPEVQDYERYDASPYDPSLYADESAQLSECGVPQCQTSECGVPQCQTSECGVPDCAPNCEPGLAARKGSVTNGFGYNPNASYSGGYTRPNNMNQRVETAPGRLGPYASDIESAEPEQIEELPPTINHIVEPSENDSFEDDGLPLEFAPPTR